MQEQESGDGACAEGGKSGRLALAANSAALTPRGDVSPEFRMFDNPPLEFRIAAREAESSENHEGYSGQKRNKNAESA